MHSSELKNFAAGQKVAGQTCSICQSGIIAGERVLYCPKCALPFHVECWDENKGCSSYGCEAAPVTEKIEETHTAPSNVWGGEKECPNCKKQIKAQALKCRFCGAAFESRDAISAEQYARREYTDKEYATARNKIMGLFLLSAAGCLAPIGLILVGILLYNKSALGIELCRLPPALKSLLYVALGISSFLVLIMLFLLAFDA